MENKSLQLWPDLPGEHVLKLFLLDGDAPRPLVVVLPGGGYCTRAAHEADPVALWFNSLGFHAAVCHYRVTPNFHPAPLSDAQRAVRTVRHNAAAWKVDPGRIGILGFSAGGHLACSTANFGDDGLAEGDAIARTPSRVNALVACYAVVSFSSDLRHVGSTDNLLGKNPDPALVHRLSLENTVTPQNPPAFIWHTFDDPVVQVQHPLRYASAMAAAGVPFSLHIYPRGPHGIGLAQDFDGEARGWTGECAEWFAGLGWRAAE